MALYLAGTCAGGAVTVAVAFVASAFVSWLPWAVAAAVVVAGLGVVVAHHLNVVAVPYPLFARMIPQERFARSRALGSLLFGAELGLGFRTYLVSPLPIYALAVFVVSKPTVAGAGAFVVGWGVARWLPVGTRWVFGARESTALIPLASSVAVGLFTSAAAVVMWFAVGVTAPC